MKNEFVFGILMALILGASLASMSVLFLTERLRLSEWFMFMVVNTVCVIFLALAVSKFEDKLYLLNRTDSRTGEDGWATCRFCGASYNPKVYHDGHDCEERRRF